MASFAFLFWGLLMPTCTPTQSAAPQRITDLGAAGAR